MNPGMIPAHGKKEIYCCRNYSKPRKWICVSIQTQQKQINKRVNVDELMKLSEDSLKALNLKTTIRMLTGLKKLLPPELMPN